MHVAGVVNMLQEFCLHSRCIDVLALPCFAESVVRVAPRNAAAAIPSRNRCMCARSRAAAARLEPTQRECYASQEVDCRDPSVAHRARGDATWQLGWRLLGASSCRCCGCARILEAQRKMSPQSRRIR